MSERTQGDLERDVERGPLNWSAVVVAAIVASLQLYDGLGPAWAGETPGAPSLFLAGLLVVGIVVFFSRYWRPALYLLGTLVGLYVFVVWLLAGMTVGITSLATAGSAVLLSVLSLANFYCEQVAYLSDEPARSTSD